MDDGIPLDVTQPGKKPGGSELTVHPLGREGKASVDAEAHTERTWERDEFGHPKLQLLPNPEVERLCRAWTEVGRAVLARRREREAGVQ